MTPDTLLGDTVAPNALRREPEPPTGQDGVDTEKKLARATRSALRLAPLSEDARNGETLDLFAEDAERAHLQALNTDIRQGTFEGFELPEVFLAAVQSNHAVPPSEAKRASKTNAAPVEPVQGLFQDEVPPSPSCNSDGTEPAKFCALAAAVPRAASISCVALDEHGAGVASQPAQSSEAPDEVPPQIKAGAEPELDRARAVAFADTVDAVHAVMIEQRMSATAHARRMKAMLSIIVCVMLATVATGIAQTVVLVHMGRDGKLQQDRMEQLMLNQQATLASLFDTDSDTVSLRHTSDARDRYEVDASPVQPVSAVSSDYPSKKNARSARHHAGSTAH
ncbi:hypothetical protein QCE63_33190 [Caballeronia sp. LZ065]|uniref:hypothetical protein n=1 Tax=Caballeronia sp. LZ065 TaxID=3038571 RepID=UPI002860CF0B|nr:hypothetical protein [Caballeronia sp. LZ065]MDR5784281.1 hypothetical protein [Caballeronia sp. LZ065]